MLETLHNGDKLFIYKVLYTPQNGDVVVLARPDNETEPYVKRIVATGGQEIDIDFTNGYVLIDGVPIDEPYLLDKTHRSGDIIFPVTVPPGHVFVLGDNRNNSLDSRFSDVGMIDERYLLGRAVIKLFPFDRMGLI
jgi:signal peptidase I